MGCGASSAKVAVEPAQSNSDSVSQQQISQLDKSSLKKPDVRTSSGKSRDSGFLDNNAVDSDFVPHSKSVGFKAPPPLTGKVQADEDESEVLRKLRNEGLIQRSMTKTNFGVSFEVVEDDRVIKSRPPPRLARLERASVQKKGLTDEQIQAKLEKAKKRRRAQEAKRLSRIRSINRQSNNVHPDPESSRNADLHTARNQNPNQLNDYYSNGYSNNNSDLNSNERNESGQYHRNMELKMDHRDESYLKSPPRPLPRITSKQNDMVSSQNLTPLNSTRKYEDELPQNDANLSINYRKSSINSYSNRDSSLLETRSGEKRPSYVGQYADDTSNRSSSLHQYSQEASLDVTAMLAAAQDRVDNYNKAEKLARASPVQYGKKSPVDDKSTERDYSPEISGRGSKWLKSDMGKNQAKSKNDVIKRDEDDKMERPSSGLSIPSMGSNDSADFWND